jgi:hypothetical protein
LSRIFQGSLKTDKLNRARAKRIPSRPGVVKHPNKAEYIRADRTCYSHFSLATRRRTIHTYKSRFAGASKKHSGTSPNSRLRPCAKFRAGDHLPGTRLLAGQYRTPPLYELCPKLMRLREIDAWHVLMDDRLRARIVGFDQVVC